MIHSIVHHLLFSSFLLCFFLANPVHSIKKSYVVYLGSHSRGPNPSVTEVESATKSHYDLLASVLGSHEKAREAIFYSYNRHINGFAAVLEEEEAAELAKNPNVLSVFLNKRRELKTTNSMQFLGLEKNGVVPVDSAWAKGSYGAGTIIANIDTGVWPESRSFSEDGIGPIPSKWKGGVCQINNLPGSTGALCNRKLIGAKFFNKGYEAYAKTKGAALPVGPEFNSARDYQGHGVQTLSIAGGNFVPGVSDFGLDFGTAKGAAPRAHVAAYKVCWPDISNTVKGGCFDADIIAAFEAAISDVVDVMAASLGPDEPEKLHEDGTAIGSFHAIAKGIVVVAAAGNEGPEAGTVSNIAPWIFTVAASTIDREFVSYVELGNGQRLKGASLTTMETASSKLYPLISGEDARLANKKAEDAKSCIAETLDRSKVMGKILVCLHAPDTGDTAEKGEQALLAGAVGIVLANDNTLKNDIDAVPHLLPASHLTYTDGVSVYNYIKITENPTAKISKAQINQGIKPAPVMAAFSSTGPNKIHPSILKPDITAPGVDIVAAFSEAANPTDLNSDTRRVPFMVSAGTSFACPHVTGIAALTKTLYPNWSPAAIRSAIMTTATRLDNDGGPIQDSSNNEATPLNYGSGHLVPNLAMDPGLVYDLGTDDYLNFLCASGYTAAQIKLFYDQGYNCPQSYDLANFNYPSITVLDLGTSSVSVTRTVTNVGSTGTYQVRINPPIGISISVQPSSLTFTQSGEKKTFTVSLNPRDAGKSGEYVYGDLSWSDGKHSVTSPIVIRRKASSPVIKSEVSPIVMESE